MCVMCFRPNFGNIIHIIKFGPRCLAWVMEWSGERVNHHYPWTMTLVNQPECRMFREAGLKITKRSQTNMSYEYYNPATVLTYPYFTLTNTNKWPKLGGCIFYCIALNSSKGWLGYLVRTALNKQCIKCKIFCSSFCIQHHIFNFPRCRRT